MDKCRKPENQDPLHKWISGYNLKRITLMRFFKWLYYPGIASPKRRNELSSEENKPECIMGIPQLKRKEISCYKPTDLWTQEDDLLFLKWVTNKRDGCYHTMARDLSARPHEILSLKIKDIVFKVVDKYQYAEVLVNGNWFSFLKVEVLHGELIYFCEQVITNELLIRFPEIFRIYNPGYWLTMPITAKAKSIVSWFRDIV